MSPRGRARPRDTHIKSVTRPWGRARPHSLSYHPQAPTFQGFLFSNRANLSSNLFFQKKIPKSYHWAPLYKFGLIMDYSYFGAYLKSYKCVILKNEGTAKRKKSCRENQ